MDLVMRRLLIYGGITVVVVVLYLIVNGIVGYFVSSAAPLYHENLRQINIYAYRSWQSVGVRVEPGELLEIRADGEWLYTPNEYHGPEGHARFPAPSYYPVGWGVGGALIGRVGENGTPFVVGRYTRQRADREGRLYLRINDDILSDNKGDMLVNVTVIPADPEYR